MNQLGPKDELEVHNVQEEDDPLEAERTAAKARTKLVLNEAKQRRCGPAQCPQSSRAIARGHQIAMASAQVTDYRRNVGTLTVAKTLLYIYIYIHIVSYPKIAKYISLFYSYIIYIYIMNIYIYEYVVILVICIYLTKYSCRSSQLYLDLSPDRFD